MRRDYSAASAKASKKIERSILCASQITSDGKLSFCFYDGKGNSLSRELTKGEALSIGATMFNFVTPRRSAKPDMANFARHLIRVSLLSENQTEHLLYRCIGTLCALDEETFEEILTEVEQKKAIERRAAR